MTKQNFLIFTSFLLMLFSISSCSNDDSFLNNEKIEKTKENARPEIKYLLGNKAKEKISDLKKIIDEYEPGVTLQGKGSDIEVSFPWGYIDNKRVAELTISDSIVSRTYKVVPNAEDKIHSYRFINLVETHLNGELYALEIHGYIMDGGFAQKYNEGTANLNEFEGISVTYDLVKDYCGSWKLQLILPEEEEPVEGGGFPGGVWPGDTPPQGGAGDFYGNYTGVYDNIYPGGGPSAGGGSSGEGHITETFKKNRDKGGSRYDTGVNVFWRKIGNFFGGIGDWISGLFSKGCACPKRGGDLDDGLSVDGDAPILINPNYSDENPETPEEPNRCAGLAYALLHHMYSPDYAAEILQLSQEDYITFLFGDKNFREDAINFLMEQEFSQESIDYFHEAFKLKREIDPFYVDFVDIFERIYNEERREFSFYEAILTLNTLATDTPWVENAGHINNVPSLEYTHTRTIDNNGRTQTQFLLTNGDIVSYGDYGEGQDITTKYWYYSQDKGYWFEIPTPYFNSNVSVDFLFDGFWTGVEIGVRYCTPFEDIIILVDGKDLNGVEQSRAVAGVFLLLEVVPGSDALKVIKVTKKVDGVIDASSPLVKRVVTPIYKTQKAIRKQYKNSTLLSPIQKGNFGEVCTDLDLIEKGYKPLHGNRIDDINSPTHQGIDHVFQNEKTGEYIIVESKYHGTGGLNPANPSSGLPRQMSDAWIESSNRLAEAVGQDLADDIIDAGYSRVLAKTAPDGSVTYKYVSDTGYLNQGGGPLGNWTP